VSDLFTRLAARALGASPVVMPLRSMVLVGGVDASPMVGEHDGSEGLSIAQVSKGHAQRDTVHLAAVREPNPEKLDRHRAAQPGQPAAALVNELARIPPTTKPNDRTGAPQHSEDSERRPKRLPIGAPIESDAQAKAKSAIKAQSPLPESPRRTAGVMVPRFGDAPRAPLSARRADPPAINITIGRVEVRTERAAKEAHESRPHAAPAVEPALTLSDYLRRDRRGQS
jgi:hypothetical protein